MLYAILLYIFPILINFLAALIGFHAGSDKGDLKRIIKKIRRKFFSLAIMATSWIVLMTGYFIGNNYNQTIEKKNERNEIISNVVKEFGTYHLKYDSSQKKIINVLRDSLKIRTTTINNHPPIPDLDFCINRPFVVTKQTEDTIIVRVIV